MSTPVYFLSGATVGKLFPADLACKQEFARYGLTELFRDVMPDKGVDWYATDLTRPSGPDGKPGVYLSALPVVSRGLPRVMSYSADDKSIRWVEIEPGVLWAGFDDQSKATPSDLARRQQQEGHYVKLADGNEWLVPAIRRPDIGDKTIVDEQGERVVRGFTDGVPRVNQQLRYDYRLRNVVSSVRPNDIRIWDWSAKFYKLVYRDGGPLTEADIPDMAEQFEFCGELLGINYRMGFAEINELGLITEADIVSIIQAAVDFPWYRERLADWSAKKNSEQQGL